MVLHRAAPRLASALYLSMFAGRLGTSGSPNEGNCSRLAHVLHRLRLTPRSEELREQIGMLGQMDPFFPEMVQVELTSCRR